MKHRWFIYAICFIVGILIGIISYSLIRFYVPNKEDKKLDFIDYNEVKENLKKIDVSYGENINWDTKFDKLISNGFNILDLEKVLVSDEEDCTYLSCIESNDTYKLNLDVLKSALRNVYGPDREYEFGDFKFNNGKYQGNCYYGLLENAYLCRVKESDSELNEVNYKIVSAYYEGEDIHIKAYAYFIKEYCDDKGRVCLYADRNLLNYIAKCKKSEIDDYLEDFNLLDIIYKKSSDNRYYLYSLNW